MNCPGSGLIMNTDSTGRNRCPYCSRRFRVGVGGKLRVHKAR